MKKKKLGFALGAGGSRGIAHIGFLKAMEEEGIYPDFIAGCSMGSVIGSAYASGMGLDAMEKAVRKLRLLDLIAPTRQRGGLFDTRKIRKLLEGYIGDIDFKDLKIPFCCVAVDMISQNLIEFSQGKVLDGVIASSSIPAIFKPLEKDGMRLIDGGILDRVPFTSVKQMGADVIVAVDVLGKLSTKEVMPTTLGVLLETIDIMDNYRTERKHLEAKDWIDFWLEPQLENMSQYSFKDFSYAIEKGYEIGKANVKKIKKALK